MRLLPGADTVVPVEATDAGLDFVRGANCLLDIPQGVSEVGVGEPFDVWLLQPW